MAPHHTFRPAGALWLLLAVAGVCPAQVPTLPAGAFDRLPAAVRGRIERVYEAALARPDDASAVGRLAIVLHAHEQLELAEACYRAAAAREPESFAWRYLTGIVRAESGNHTMAAEDFRAAHRLDPSSLPAWVRLAESLLKAGSLAESRDEYAELVARYPEHAVAHFGLGHALAAQGRISEAARHYRRAVELIPEFGAAHYSLALAYRDLGQDQDARRHLDAYRTHGSSRPTLADPLLEKVRAMSGTARELIAEATRLGRAGRLEESIAMHERALDADPSAAQAHVNLISLFGRTNRPEKAEEHYKAALSLGANLGDAHYNYGVLRASQRRYGEAVAAFRLALRVNPFHAQAHNNLAGLLAQHERHDEAIEHYIQAVANDPQHRTARFNLARTLTAVGRYREAIEQLHKVLVPGDAETPRYTFALAEAYYRSGDPERARQYGVDALRQAERMGQARLAAAIAKALQRIDKERE